MLKNDKGFFILESLVAIIIFAIGILGMVKLQYLTSEYTQQSIMRSQITFILEQYLAEVSLTTDFTQKNLSTQEANSKVCGLISPFFNSTDSSGGPHPCPAPIIYDDNTNTASVFWKKYDSNDKPNSVTIRAPSL